MADVEVALKTVAHIALKPLGIFQSLASRQELLALLLKDEQIRLMVWLFPLDHDRRRIFGHGAPETTEKPVVSDVSDHLVYRHQCWANSLKLVLLRLLKIAWAEDPSLTVRLAERFPSPTTANEVRSLLLNASDQAVGEPDAVQILLGDALPTDAEFQLRVSPQEHLTCVWLIRTVFTLLGTGKSNHSCHLLQNRIWEQSLRFTICYACSRES